MSLKKQATSGLVWTFSQQFGNQLIGFLVSLILARILLPEEFGLIGMISVFIAIGNALLKSGLTQSLIRSSEIDQEDLSTVFFFNLLASILIYFGIYLGAPYVASFYSQPVLVGILRLFCLTFILGGLSAVQLARMTKEMNFRILTIISIPSTLIGGIVGISMAYMGFGVWSLVWSTLIGSLVNTILLWKYSEWSPQFIFKLSKFRNHLNFGYKLTLAGLLETIFNNIYIIIIGKFFSASQVGFYTRAETVKQLPVANISHALNQVTFPLFSNIQDDDARLKRVYSQLMKMVIFIVTPLLVFMAVLGEPLFRFMFTEKWLPAVPYFQILCITGILFPIHTYNLNVLKVKGRSDLFLKLEVIKKVIIVGTIVVAIRFGILALLYGQVFISILSFFINAHYTGRFINYSAFQQIRDITPSLLLSIFAGGVVFVVDHFSLGSNMDIIRIAGGGAAGVLIYLLGAYFFRFSSLYEIQVLLKTNLKHQ